MKKRLFKPGDMVILITNEIHPDETENWSKHDGLVVGKTYRVIEQNQFSINRSGWICIDGPLKFSHPSDKFRKVKVISRMPNWL